MDVCVCSATLMTVTITENGSRVYEKPADHLCGVLECHWNELWAHRLRNPVLRLYKWF
jgi:hypothetical protein